MRLLLIALFVGFVLLPQQQPNGGVERKETQNAPTREAAPQSPVSISNTLNCEPTKEANQAQTNKPATVPNDWRSAVNAWSTLAIALFTILTVAVLRYQIATTHRLERPWIIVRKWDGPTTLISDVDISGSGQPGKYVFNGFRLGGPDAYNRHT